MKTRVQIFREEKNLTQSELAERSKLSLRTIQRVEAGKIPKGFTLAAIAKSLETAPENLIQNATNEAIFNRAKLINISALTSLILPFGNIIFPAVLTYNSKESKAKELGKEILSIQIIYTFLLSIFLIISLFIQKKFSIQTPLFIIILVLMKCINFYIIIKNGTSLTKTKDLCIRPNINFI